MIEVDSKNVASIRSGPSFFKILGLPEEEFPPLPKFDKAKAFTLRQKDLKDGLKKTAYAISTDETRYVLNGILFTFKDNKLTLVATDGRRLALVDIELEFPRSQEVDIIVPSKAVTELGRLLGEDGDVKLTVGENQIAFEVDGTLLVSKLIEGNYPNYRQVIPAETKERITLERELFLNCVHRVSLLASEKSNSVKLDFLQEQHRHHREHARRRRSQGIDGRAIQREGIFHRIQPGIPDGPLEEPDKRRGVSRPYRRDEPRRDQDPDPVPLRADADAHQLNLRFAIYDLQFRVASTFRRV